MAVLTAIAAGAAVIGAGLGIWGAIEADEAAEDRAAAERIIADAKLEELRVNQAGQKTLNKTKKDLYNLSLKQDELTTDLKLDVAGYEKKIEGIKVDQNYLYQDLNAVKKDAAIYTEGLNKKNDALNASAYGLTKQQQDLELQGYGNDQRRLDVELDRLDVEESELDLKDRLAKLDAMREQRKAVRTGLVQRALGLQTGVNRGTQFSSATEGVAGNAINAKTLAVLKASQDLQGKLAGTALDRDDIDLRAKDVGIRSDNLDLKTSSAKLGFDKTALEEQSRLLKVQAREKDYEVDLAEFDTSDKLYDKQLYIAGYNSLISDAYIDSYKTNLDYTKEANSLNQRYIDESQIASDAVAAAQEKVIAAGGDVATANYSAASAATLGNIGSGLGSLGSLGLKNTETIASVGKSLFGGGVTGDYLVDDSSGLEFVG